MAWLSVKLEGGVWDLNPAGMGSLMSSDWVKSDPFRMDLNEVPVVKSTLADTRVTVGLWDDWVRLTSRQAVSNYVTPGTNVGYLVRPGFGADEVATSQHIDAGIWKTESMRLSVFAEYDRVGAYFEAPNFAIKPQDPFATPNSTTMRLGTAATWGPITFTLEQRTQQSLAEYNAPIKVENQIGLSLSLDDLRTRTGWFPQGMSWILPSSTYLIVGRGRVSAAPDQGVNGDTISDVSAGLSWNVGKFATISRPQAPRKPTSTGTAEIRSRQSASVCPRSEQAGPVAAQPFQPLRRLPPRVLRPGGGHTTFSSF